MVFGEKHRCCIWNYVNHHNFKMILRYFFTFSFNSDAEWNRFFLCFLEPVLAWRVAQASP